MVVGFLVVFKGIQRPDRSTQESNLFSLKAPAFVGVAEAEMNNPALSLEDEAGISAYFQAPNTINLDDVRNEFRTIETETSTYIIGSIPVPGYNESQDAHAYVHVDGWVLAYYLADEPVSKIFDWFTYDGTSINTTRLQNVLVVIAGAVGSLSLEQHTTIFATQTQPI